jgi:hypothetical protein
MTLIRYVFRYHLIGHIAAAAAEIPSRPQMSSPKLPVQMRKFPHQLVRRLPLQPLDQSAYRYLWRYRHKQMQMIFRHMPLQARHFVRTENLLKPSPKGEGFNPPRVGQ